MKLIIQMIIVFVSLSTFTTAQQIESRIPVSASRSGRDELGALFLTAFRKELAKSSKYEHISDPPSRGLRLYVQLATVDAAPNSDAAGKASAISVVIEDMGLPNSWPVPTLWYHKIIVSRRDNLGKIAKELVQDMDARWCRTVKNSERGCPDELFQ